MDIASIPTRLLDAVGGQSRPTDADPIGSGDQSPVSGKPHVQVVGGKSAATDELSLLLKRRLQGLLLLTGLEMFIALLTTLFLPLLALRVAILLVVILFNIVLRRFDSLTLNQLRWIELGGLTTLAIQCTSMPIVLMMDRASAHDAITVTMDEYFALGVWAVAMLAYGLLIPNTWRRAAMVIAPFACVVNLGFYLLGRYDPMVQSAFDSLHHGPPAPIVLLGALGGVYGAHTIHVIRRDESRARQFGRYILREKLGAGGMGEVFRAEHDLLKRPCALKLINTAKVFDPSAIARFEREVQATSKLTHASTVEIYDYGQTDDGDFYYVMELLSGMSLHDIIDHTGPMPPARVVHLLRQICGALKEAHALGLIHRDIKPANIFAAHQGGIDDVAKLLDFGLVRSVGSTRDMNLTQFGAACGSPPYMSPEQGNASDLIDGRSDLYALGSVAYFLLTARPPFTGKTSMDILVSLMRDQVLPPSILDARIPKDLEAVVLRCLEKSPDKRFADAQSLNEALGACRCANDWTAELGAQWWRRYRESRPPVGVPKAARADGSPVQASRSEWFVPITDDGAAAREKAK